MMLVTEGRSDSGFTPTYIGSLVENAGLQNRKMRGRVLPDVPAREGIYDRSCAVTEYAGISCDSRTDGK